MPRVIRIFPIGKVKPRTLPEPPEDVVCYLLISADEHGVRPPMRFEADDRQLAVQLMVRRSIAWACEGRMGMCLLTAVTLDGPNRTVLDHRGALRLGCRNHDMLPREGYAYRFGPPPPDCDADLTLTFSFARVCHDGDDFYNLDVTRKETR